MNVILLRFIIENDEMTDHTFSDKVKTRIFDNFEIDFSLIDIR